MVVVLEKAIGALESGQRVAALDHLRRALEENPGVPSYLSLKAQVEMQLNEWDAAKATCEAYVNAHPKSCDALSLQACVIAVTEGDTRASIDKLQDALEAAEETLTASAVQAFGVIGELLLSQGHVAAALGHLSVQAEAAGEEAKRSVQALDNIRMSSRVPTLLKEFGVDYPVKDEHEWSAQYKAEIVPNLNRGRWRAAIEHFKELSKKYPGEPSLLIPTARLYGMLDMMKEHVAAIRKVAASSKISEDDAVELESRAHLLDPDIDIPKYDELKLTYTVDDVEKLNEHLLAHPRVSAVPVDPQQLTTDGSPPPRGVYLLLDKPMPAEDATLTIDNIPEILGEMLVFGKQTDRSACVELLITKSDDFWLKTTSAAEVLGPMASSAPSEEVVGDVPAESEQLMWRWRFPDGTDQEIVQRLSAEKRDKIIFEKWPIVSSAGLGNKKPRDVASDGDYRLRLLATIKNLELQADANGWGIDFNRLRTDLGLPAEELVSGDVLDIHTVPLARMHRLDVTKLSDEDLIWGFRRSTSFRVLGAAETFAVELAGRESCAATFPDFQVYASLSMVYGEDPKSIEYIIKSQEAAAKVNGPVGHLLLAELNLRFMRGEIQEIERLVQTIQTRHMNDPGVADALFQTLVRYKVISPDGMPTMPRQAPDPSDGGADSGLWTPDGGGPPQGGGESESKLWMPGMD
ncbi:MAG: tetratricopeptide (TPR) repeat protein [Pirellulaceae bacterium]|jgi:tetratricopeptide (TPR) repeat protein